MRSGFRPAVSDVSDDRALFDDRADREELHALEVRVTGHDAMTVIDPHLASAELVEDLDRGVSEAEPNVFALDLLVHAPLGVCGVDPNDLPRLCRGDGHAEGEREVDAF